MPQTVSAVVAEQRGTTSGVLIAGPTSLRKSIPKRRHRTSPRPLKRIRHNHYRVEKRGEASRTRPFGPATVRIHCIQL